MSAAPWRRGHCLWSRTPVGGRRLRRDRDNLSRLAAGMSVPLASYREQGILCRLQTTPVLVMAAGSVSRVVPIEGLSEYGAGLKTLGERVHLRNHVLSQLGSARVHGRRGAGPGCAGRRRCQAGWPGPRRRAGRSRSRLGHRRGRCRPRASPSARGRAREGRRGRSPSALCVGGLQAGSAVGAAPDQDDLRRDAEAGRE
jgi:hypothetical protein